MLSSGAQQPIFAAISVPKPVLGNANYIATVPAGQQWRVKTLYVTLTTGATAGNRTVFLIAQGNAVALRLGTVFATILQPASKVYEYSFGSSGFVNDVMDNALGFETLGIPEFIIPPGGIIGVGAFGFLATDQWSLMTIGVEITYPYKI
jgi:hypothetical protein